MRQLEGRVALVTGASKGVGRVMSRMFAAAGAAIICAARSRNLVEETAALVTADGGRAIAAVGDAAIDVVLMGVGGADLALLHELAQHLPQHPAAWVGVSCQGVVGGLGRIARCGRDLVVVGPDVCEGERAVLLGLMALALPTQMLDLLVSLAQPPLQLLEAYGVGRSSSAVT